MKTRKADWTSREARKLPWRITSLAILNKDANCVVLRPSATPDTQINQRMFNDSEFIIRAVNSYHEMLAALKNISQNIEGLPEIISRGACLVGDMESIESMRVWAKEGIAKAEGK